MAYKNSDLLHGNISRSIFSFCIPLIIGSLLQVFFNMADQIVLGQMAGGVALASVGACSTVVGLIVNFFVGLSSGVTVVLSRAVGMNDNEACKRIISTAFISSLIVGAIAAGGAIPFASPLLRLTKCPEVCFADARTYTLIYYSGIPAITVYNFSAGILRATGDSRRPTFYMVIAGALNLVLNITLCLIMQNKVAAVAIATVVSQLLGAVLTVKRLLNMEQVYRLSFSHLKFSNDIFLKFLRYGVPNGFCSSLYNIANLQVQAGINAFGTDAIAGHAAAASIDSLITPFVGSFGITTATMVGQNIGAGNRERVKQSIFVNMAYSVSIACVLCFSVYLFRIPLIKLYVPDSPGAIEYAVIRMQWVLLWFGVNAFNNILINTLNAFGYSVFAMISNIITTVVFRTFWMQLLYPHYPTFRTIMMCYTVSWCMTVVLYSIAFSYVFTRFLHGKTKKL